MSNIEDNIIAGRIGAFLSSRIEEYLADLKALTAMDSYSYDRDDVNKVNDWLESRLERMEFAVTRYPEDHFGDNLVAVREGSGRGKILLVGHSDTVFPKGIAAQRPMEIDGDNILAPGSYDMKGGLLSGIYAVQALDEVEFSNYERITVLVVSDEEIDARASVPLILKSVRGQDAVLTLEGARSNGDIVTARKGNVWFYATAHGRSAHAGVEPEKGRNAIMGLVNRLSRVSELANPERGNTINVGTIEGGTLPNVVPERAKVGLDLRSFYQEDLERMVEDLQEVFHDPEPNGVRFETESIYSSPPMPYTPEIQKIERLAQAAAAEFEFEVKGAQTGGAADAAFAAAEGVPALDGLGPVGGLDHSPDEYMLLSSIVPRTGMLARLMMLIAEQVQSR